MQSFRSETERNISRDPDFCWLTIVAGDEQRVFTLRQLGERIHDYLTHYRARGVRQGDTVLIVLKESLDLFASFFAGVIYGALPAYFAYPSPKQSHDAFLVSVAHLARYNSIRLVVAFDGIVGILRHHESLRQPEFLGVVDCATVPAHGAMAFGEFDVPDREAFLQFSSGTTGAKKGVRISARALFNQIRAYSMCVRFDDDSRVVSWLPHYHDMGLIACMLMPFLKHVPLVMMSPFDWVKNPRMLLEAIARYRGTHCWQPNFALGHMAMNISDDEARNYNLRSLRQLVLCSEPVLHDTVQKFLRRFTPAGLASDALFNCYAMAENTFAMTSTGGKGIAFIEVDQAVFQREHRIEQRQGGRNIASVGTPLDNIAIRVLDGNGSALPENIVGEIVIKSDCMLDGYHNNAEETTKAMTPDSWFRTGDLGFLRKGELYVTGRRKDMIIVGGENIYPQDIELILNETPYLVAGRNVVFGIEDDRIGTERIVVLAELKDGVSAPDTTELRSKIFSALNVSVADIVLLPHMSLRKGTAGKISRYLNKREYLNGTFAGRAHSAPHDTEGESLREVVLGVVPSPAKPEVDRDTPLLSSGIIDSFGFAQLILALEKAYQISIPEQLWKPDNFQTLAAIERTLKSLDNDGQVGDTSDNFSEERTASLARLKSKRKVSPGKGPLLERVINRFPFKGSFWFRPLLRMAGIRVGSNVEFLGRVKVKLRGQPNNIVIGDNVVLGDNVDLRNRENGRIILKERVYLDSNVRIVAAREGVIEIGFGSEVGGGSIINSGGTTRIGEFCMIAGGVNINASRHGTQKKRYIKEQPHSHGFVELGDDVWIGSGASLLINTRIGTGAVVSSNSLVSGEIPAFAVCVGVPARVIQYR